MKKLIPQLLLLFFIPLSLITPQSISAQSLPAASVMAEEFNVSVSMTPSKTIVQPGESFDLTVTVQNHDIFINENITLGDSLHLNPYLCTNKTFPCVEDVSQIYSFGDLLPGELKTQIVKYYVSPDAPLGIQLKNNDYNGTGAVLSTTHLNGIDVIQDHIVWSVNTSAANLKDLTLNKLIVNRVVDDNKISGNYTGSGFSTGQELSLILENLNTNATYYVTNELPAKNGNADFTWNLPNGIPDGLYSAFLSTNTRYFDLNGNEIIVNSNKVNIHIISYDIKVVTPNGGEFFRKGDTATIKWTMDHINSDAKVNTIVFLTPENGVLGDALPVAYLGQSVVGENSVDYIVPNWIRLGKYKVSITTNPSNVNIESDTSDDFFTIGEIVEVTPSPTPSPTPTLEPTVTPTLTPSPTPIVTPTPYSEPDFLNCSNNGSAQNCNWIADYQGSLLNRSEYKIKTYEFELETDAMVYIAGYAKEGHPEVGCPNPDPESLCNQNQANEDFDVFINDKLVHSYRDRGAEVNAWNRLDSSQIKYVTLKKGKYKITFRHAQKAVGVNSIDYKVSLFYFLPSIVTSP